jgi:glucose-1-phosphate thymidylyltransferase
MTLACVLKVRLVALVGVIPAAGSATRLGPLPSSKEVLPVGERPVMDYLVERMRAVGCDEIRVVTRADKADVVDRAKELGLRVVLADPPTASESVASGLDGLTGDDVVLLGFPDSIWEPADGFLRLLDALDGECAAVLGLFRTADLERSDVVSLDEDGVVTAVDIKPQRPESEWIWGCAAVRATALADVASAGELGRHFGSLARRGLVRGVRLSDRWVDVGTRAGLSRARTTVAVT